MSDNIPPFFALEEYTMYQTRSEAAQDASQSFFEANKILDSQHALAIFVCRLKDFTLCFELYGGHVTEEIENLLQAGLNAHVWDEKALDTRHTLRIGPA